MQVLLLAQRFFHCECTESKDTHMCNIVHPCMYRARTWAPGHGHVTVGIAIIVAAICNI
jgi:hypothetical protein